MHEERIRKMTFTSNGDTLVTVSDKYLKTWLVKDNTFHIQKTIRTSMKITNLKLVEDDKNDGVKAILTSDNGKAMLVSVPSGTTESDYQHTFPLDLIAVTDNEIILGGSKENPFLLVFDHDLQYKKAYLIMKMETQQDLAYAQMFFLYKDPELSFSKAAGGKESSKLQKTRFVTIDASKVIERKNDTPTQMVFTQMTKKVLMPKFITTDGQSNLYVHGDNNNLMLLDSHDHYAIIEQSQDTFANITGAVTLANNVIWHSNKKLLPQKEFKKGTSFPSINSDIGLTTQNEIIFLQGDQKRVLPLKSLNKTHGELSVESTLEITDGIYRISHYLNGQYLAYDKALLNEYKFEYFKAMMKTSETDKHGRKLVHTVNLEKPGHLFLFKNNAFDRAIQDNSDFVSYGLVQNRIVAGLKNGKVKAYDYDGQVLHEYVGNDQEVFGIAANEDYIASLSKNNIVKIWKFAKINTGYSYPLVSIYFDAQGEYLIWTEEGYFTVSSPKALKYITWHMNRGYDKEAYRYDLGKFYDVFFRPDLVKLKLQGKDITPYTGGLTAKDALKNPPPSVAINEVHDQQSHTISSSLEIPVVSTKKDKVKVKFSVQDEGGGVGTIRVYQEGKLVHVLGKEQINKVTATADVKVAEKTFEESKRKQIAIALAKAVNKEALNLEDRIGQVQRSVATNQAGVYEVELDLRKGSNDISIEAFNKTNTITSFRASVNIDADIKVQPSKLYAIIAGVNEFQAPNVQNLRYAVNDAASISEVIRQSQDKIYDEVEVIDLRDQDVTKEKLYAAFENVKAKASLNDTVVFYISTHGVSANGTFYLFPSNNISVNQFIDFNDLFKMSASIKSLNQMFIVDACQSGGALDIASAVYDSRASVMARNAGIHLLSASTSGTSAFENEEQKHGAFTYEILSTLNSKESDANADGYISIIEISNTLQEKNRQQEGSQQLPVIRNVGQDIRVNQL